MSQSPASLFQLGADETAYRKLSAEGVRIERALGRDVLIVERAALSQLAEAAMVDINHLLRPGHLAQLAAILDDSEATANDKFVAYDLLKNANIAAGGVLPMCQDTGTAIVTAKKGRLVWTEGDDEAALAEGIRAAYVKTNLRYSQVAPLSMYDEVNTGDNLPAQIDLSHEGATIYTISCSSPRAAARPIRASSISRPGGAEPEIAHQVPGREDQDARHGRLPALSPGDRHRRPAPN